jgi:hypothetical protein
MGKAVSLMLKQSPLIDELSLYDTRTLEGFATDLNYIDTKCIVRSYYGTKDIQQALSVRHNFFFKVALIVDYSEIKHSCYSCQRATDRHSQL